MQTSELIETLRTQSAEIANAGFSGWGNTMTDAADALQRCAFAESELRKVSAKAESDLRKIPVVLNDVVKVLLKGLLTDGVHHKQWSLEQAFRELCTESYVDHAKEKFQWEDGIAP